ncbi:hypothetical protein [Actinokineospora xionganensis]|uniref:Uncharacterized protein n=1 Tax=Actinokineospora xionganensis TaxID=2684470 RepID=A0ABR7LF23_9PSEU|nr:hypothetical protein [Actinokineospora xionganensis]MBC6451319.1 hypothetical protein [Actinokineospora xionganensis]
MTRPSRKLITAEAFPTPALILRTNDPIGQRRVREFARKQTQAALLLHQAITDGLRAAGDVNDRVAVFTTAFEAAENWRYRIAVSSPFPSGRYAAGHAERFRTPITDDNPNLFRVGEHERLRENAVWDPATRTYIGGEETPASRTMRQIGALAAARFARSPGVDVVNNQVTLPDGRVVGGMRLLRGRAAHHAATEMIARIAAQCGDTSRIIADGDLIYAASALETDRTTTFHGAMTLLAQDHASRAAALAAWLAAAYLLYQAPRTKRGSDAINRTFLIAAGTRLLGHTPVLLHDIDLRAIVQPMDQFLAELRSAQATPT